MRKEHQIVDGIEKKHCSRCDRWLVISHYAKAKATWDGLQTACKLCGIQSHKEWVSKNRERLRQLRINHYWKNPEKQREIKREIRRSNPHYKESHSEWYHKNREKILAKCKERKGTERAKDIARKWYKKNAEKIRSRKGLASKSEAYKKVRRARERRVLAINPKLKLNKNISNQIWISLRRQNKQRRHWESLVEYDVNTLAKYLEKKFCDGMSWDNYGKWHIEHKVPKWAFNFEKPEDIDFKRCWALSNLRPMWAKDNLSKGSKLSKPFQPALRLAV